MTDNPYEDWPSGSGRTDQPGRGPQGQQPYQYQQPYQQAGQMPPQGQPYGSPGPSQPPVGAYQSQPPNPYGAPQPYGFGGQPPEPPKKHGRRRVLIASVAIVGAVLLLVGVGGMILRQVHKVAASACADTAISHELADTDVPAGFEKAAGDGVAVAVPESFETFELTQQHIDEVDQQAKADPAVAAARDQAKDLMTNDGVLLEIDHTNGDNVSVIRAAGAVGCALPTEIDKQAGNELGNRGADVQSVRHVTIGGRKAVEVQYKISGGAGGQATGAQVYLPGKSAVYILTITSLSLSEQDMDWIAKSLRIS